MGCYFDRIQYLRVQRELREDFNVMLNYWIERGLIKGF